MAYTYSLSFGRVNLKHTQRKESNTKENIDERLTTYNVCLKDEVGGRSIKEYTNDYFQPVIDAFNAKQRRKDRRITQSYTDYFKDDKRRNKKGKSSYVQEMVIQVGNHEDIGREWYNTKNEGLRQGITDMYAEILTQMEKKYPHMHIMAAYIHFDEPEGTPHMHCIVEYIGDAYKRGPEKQISIGRALEQDGIERLNERGQAIEEGYQQERQIKDIKENIIEPTMQRCGLKAKPNEKSGKEHLTKEEWEKIRDVESKASEIFERLKFFLETHAPLIATKPKIEVIAQELWKEHEENVKEHAEVLNTKITRNTKGILFGRLRETAEKAEKSAKAIEQFIETEMEEERER